MGGNQVSNRTIPSNEEIARARAAMEECDRGLSEVRSSILKKFYEEGLHEVFILYSPVNNLFVVHLFYDRADQVEAAEESGLASRIKSSIVEQLERHRREQKGSIKVEFDFDSHENVVNNFEGNYFLRLR